MKDIWIAMLWFNRNLNALSEPQIKQANDQYLLIRSPLESPNNNIPVLTYLIPSWAPHPHPIIIYWYLLIRAPLESTQNFSYVWQQAAKSVQNSLKQKHSLILQPTVHYQFSAIVCYFTYEVKYIDVLLYSSVHNCWCIHLPK